MCDVTHNIETSHGLTSLSLYNAVTNNYQYQDSWEHLGLSIRTKVSLITAIKMICIKLFSIYKLFIEETCG